MEELLNWIGLTVILLAVVVSIIISEAWALGRDYVYITKNKAKRLNRVEKWIDGFKRLLQI
jgi:ABC-type Fe3+ transport system permease subunit